MENIFTGLGYNNWLTYLSYIYPEGVGPLAKIEEQHNIYIEAATEAGIFSLLIFLLMIFYAFKYNAETRTMALRLDNKLLFCLAYGLDAGMIGFLIAGSFVTVLFYPFFWVQLTMIVMVNNVARQGLPKKTKRARKNKMIPD